jgi:uncharacterized protein YceK
MKVAIVLLVCVALCGCASLSYETKDGTKVSYTRFWTTADSIEGNVANANIKVNNTKIDAATLQSLLNLLGAAK